MKCGRGVGRGGCVQRRKATGQPGGTIQASKAADTGCVKKKKIGICLIFRTKFSAMFGQRFIGLILFGCSFTLFFFGSGHGYRYKDTLSDKVVRCHFANTYGFRRMHCWPSENKRTNKLMRLWHRDRRASVTRHRRNTPFVRAAAISSFRGHINRLIILGLESTRTYSGSVTILTLIPSFIFFFVLLILFVVLRKATLSGMQRPARLLVLPVIIIIVKLRELLILNNHDKAIRRKLGQPHLNQCITAILNNDYYY